MKLKVIEQTENDIKIEFSGETHTLLNTLKSSLLEDPRVEIATYDIKHTSVSDPILFVRTNGINPITAIKEAADRLIEVYEEFKTVFGKKADI